jgi:hypothetical protein
LSVLGENFVANAAESVVPRAILAPGMAAEILRSNEFFWSKRRDVLFLMYEPGLLLAWGLGGLIAMGWCLWRSRKKEKKTFWIGFVIWTYVGGLLVCTPPSYYLGGVAHIILQPVVWVGLAWLASRAWRMPGWLLRLWWAGIFIDACWLMLHLILEARVLRYVKSAGGYRPADPLAASFPTLENGFFQQQRGLHLLGMQTIYYNPLILTALICGALLWWWSLRWNFNADPRRR